MAGTLDFTLDLRTNRFLRGMRSVSSSMMGFLGLTAGVTAIGYAFQKAMKSGIAFNSMIEDSTVAFETLLGSSAAASKRVEEITDFSASTPFQIGEVMQMNKMLQALTGGHVDRSYDGIASLQCMMADDFTLNSYVYVPDGKGWFHLTRGQTLIFIDYRSLKILGWSFEPRAGYSSLSIRGLCTHIFSEYGVPNTMYWERGIWYTAALLKGKQRGLYDSTRFADRIRQGAFAFTEISQGLHEFGINFIHAIRPRSKPVERIGGLIQDLLNGEPGYSGRDERRDAPESLRKEMAEVKGRKAHPADYFYSADQWNKRLGEVFMQYNGTVQEGRQLAGLSPDQAFEQFIDPKNPPIQFGAQMRYLFAHDKRVTRITLNGVTLQIGKQRFNYKGRQIAHLVGREVMAWFDPENTEILTVTDLNRENPICVERSQNPNALEALTDPDAGTLASEMKRIEGQASHMKTRFNVIKNKFPLPQRQLLADAQSVDLGQQIDQDKEIIRKQQTERKQRRSRNARFEQDTGIAVPANGQSEGTPEDARALREFLRGGSKA